MLTTLQAAILGLVQGLAEFLPISSSGHLILARLLMGIPEESMKSGAYLMLDILLHVGTLIPVVIIFWADWWDMLKHFLFRSRTFLLLIVASIPALIANFLLGDVIDSMFTGWFLGVSFLITALFLLLAEAASRFTANRTSEKVSFLQAVVMGCMQAIALLPGVSRSGSTLTGGLFSGLTRQKAAKFSFMMSAPAIAGSLLFEGKDALEKGLFKQIELVPTLVGIIVAAVSGYLAIRYMLRLIQKVSLNWFALYVAILGVVILLLQLVGSPAVPSFDLPSILSSVPLG